jgi:endonuclease III
MKLREKIDKLKIFVYELYPDAKTELEYENDFQLLVSIIMSAQTTDKQVNKVNKEFFKVLKTPENWVDLWIENIEKYIRSVSFFRNKAKNIFLTSEILSKNPIENFDTLEKLTSLNWVWIKTAKVFLAVVKNASHLAVDTHVHRVLNRVWIVKTNSPLQTNNEAEKVLNWDDLSKLHHSLIMFWRYFCTARKPNCPECKLKDICNYYKEKIKKQ